MSAKVLIVSSKEAGGTHASIRWLFMNPGLHLIQNVSDKLSGTGENSLSILVIVKGLPAAF